jgi:hypothetical protein
MTKKIEFQTIRRNIKELREKVNKNKKIYLINLIPLVLSLIYLYPFDGKFYYFWDQSILLSDKSSFWDGFYIFQERNGLGNLGYYIIFSFYSIFNLLFSPLLGWYLQTISIVTVAFWGIFLLTSEIERIAKNYWNKDGGPEKKKDKTAGLNFKLEDTIKKYIPLLISNNYSTILKILLATFYVVNLDTQLNVFRLQLAQNFFWSFIPLCSFLLMRILQKRNYLSWVGYGLSLLFLFISFSHPSQTLNYFFVSGVFVLLLIIFSKIKWERLIYVSVLNGLIFLPIFIQMVTSYNNISESIYTSGNFSEWEVVREWFSGQSDRFKTHNILSYNFSTEAFNPIYSIPWPDFIIAEQNRTHNNLSGNPIYYFNLSLLVLLVTSLFGYNLLRFKRYLFVSYFWFLFIFSVAFMGMFEGVFNSLFNYLVKIVPQIFMFYRFLDQKFGSVFYLFLITLLFVTVITQKNKTVKIFYTSWIALIVFVTFLNFSVVRPYSSPNNRAYIPEEYPQTCEKIKENSFRTLKFPYSKDYLNTVRLDDQTRIISNDFFLANCNHPIISVRTNGLQEEKEWRLMYKNLISNPEKFLDNLQEYSIDSLLVEKHFIPNHRFYDVGSEQEKNYLIKQIENNYQEKVILDNQYFTIYKFADASPLSLVGNDKNEERIDYQRISPTLYKLNIDNFNQDSKLLFKFDFNRNWALSTNYSPIGINSVNLFPQEEYDQSFNSWKLNYKSIASNCEPRFCKKNDDGSLDLNLTLFLNTQRYFEIAGILSPIFILTTYIVIFIRERKML